MEKEDTKSARPDATTNTGPDSLDPQAADRERAGRVEEELLKMPVQDYLLLMMHSLSDLAYARLGLIRRGDFTRDLDGARLAIEGFRALLGVVETVSSSQHLSAHRSVLAQLQLAYAAAVETATKEAATKKSDTESGSSATQSSGVANEGQS